MRDIPVNLGGYKLTVVEPPAPKMREDAKGEQVLVTDRDGATQFTVSLFAKLRVKAGERAPKGEEIKVTLSTDPGPDFGEDVALLDREARRCREIMTDLARRAEVDAPFPHVPLRVLLHEVVQPFEASGKSVVVEAPATVVARTPELLHGLVNLVDNAVRHAAREVRIVAIADAETVTLQILDDGAGFPPELLPHLGEPYLGPSRSARGGTGLGIFIATTLIERTGGALTFRNAAGGGAVVEINWPIAYIAAGTEGQA